jgi:hypothetical protein
MQIERNNKEEEEAKQITRTHFSGVKSKLIYPGLPHGKMWPCRSKWGHIFTVRIASVARFRNSGIEELKSYREMLCRQAKWDLPWNVVLLKKTLRVCLKRKEEAG